MYTVGFIRKCYPDVLINPVSCKSFAELLKWFNQYVNEEGKYGRSDYLIDTLADTLERERAVTINLDKGIALVFAIADCMEKDIHQRIYLD